LLVQKADGFFEVLALLCRIKLNATGFGAITLGAWSASAGALALGWGVIGADVRGRNPATPAPPAAILPISELIVGLSCFKSMLNKKGQL